MLKSNESSDRITTRAEQVIAESLLSILNPMATGDRIPESSELRDVLSALEYFVPEVMREVHPEWTHESLDGVFPLVAEKTGVRQMSIFGQCILMSDQTIVPLFVELQVDITGEKLAWLECKLGARDKSGTAWTPYRSASARIKLLHSLDGKRDLIDWAYIVTFGKEPTDTRRSRLVERLSNFTICWDVAKVSHASPESSPFNSDGAKIHPGFQNSGDSRIVEQVEEGYLPDSFWSL